MNIDWKKMFRSVICYLVFAVIGMLHGALYCGGMINDVIGNSMNTLIAFIIGITILTFVAVMFTHNKLKELYPAPKLACSLVMSEISVIVIFMYLHDHAEEFNIDGLGLLIMIVLMQILYLVVGILVLVYMSKSLYKMKFSADSIVTVLFVFIIFYALYNICNIAVIFLANTLN